MPGMTTMPTFLSAPPANSSARPIDGTIAPANIPDAQDASNVTSNPATVIAAQTSSSDVASSAEAGGTPDSFADVLQRQMAQTSATDAPPSDFPLLPGLTLPIQPISGAVTAISLAPVTVESLLSDLSEFTDRRPLGTTPMPVSAGLTVAEDIQSVPVASDRSPADTIGLVDTAKIVPENPTNFPAGAKGFDPFLQPVSGPKPSRSEFTNLPADVKVSATLIQTVEPPKLSSNDSPTLPATAEVADVALKPSPVAVPAAVEVRLSDAISQPAVPAKEDDAPPEVALYGLPSMAPLIQSLPPSEVTKPFAGVTGNDRKAVSTNTGVLLLTPALPTTVAAQSEIGKEAAPTTRPEVLLEIAGKSAEFAATQDILTAIPSANSDRSESIEPERSFDALLAATQTFNQHRNTGVLAANSPSAALPIHTPVGTRGWDGEVSDKLVWMVGRLEQRAELVLNPPQMGRIEVSLSMNDGQTSALFVSANPAVRDALEAALPRLREILADAGINLGQTQVGADTGNGAGNSSTNGAENRDNSGRGLSTKQLPPSNEILRQLDAPQWLKRGNGLVDIFA